MINGFIASLDRDKVVGDVMCKNKFLKVDIFHTVAVFDTKQKPIVFIGGRLKNKYFCCCIFFLSRKQAQKHMQQKKSFFPSGAR